MRAALRTALMLLLPVLLRGQAATAKPITIGRIDTLYSTTLKEKRPYLVYTPPSYSDTTYTPRTYPVLYLLDGDAHFHSVSGLIQILATGVNGTWAVPEMIVVAIPNTNRMRDLTPTRATTDPAGKPLAGASSMGGMPAFLQFVQKELIPHVDSTLRTAPYRVFVGHSLGGITTIDALFTMPETFNAYVAIDPSLWWDHRVLLKQTKDYFSSPRPAGRTLYVAQANTLRADDSLPNEHYASIVQFNRILEAYNRSGVRYGYHYYANDDHGSVPMIAEYDALRFIFDGFKLDLAQALDRPAYVTEHYADVSKQLGYAVLPPESIVDQLGAFSLPEPAKAMAFRRMNTTLYPSSVRAWSTLGAALLASRDTAPAIAAFERAVALRPTNKDMQVTLRKLKGGK